MAKKITETIIVPVRVSKESTYALAVRIPSRNGVVIKVFHNLLDNKRAYFGQASMEKVLRHLGRGLLIDQRLAPSDAEIEGLRRQRLEEEFARTYNKGVFFSPYDELDTLKFYHLYCGRCKHGSGCEHGVPALYFGPQRPFQDGKYTVYDADHTPLRTDNYAFAKRVLRKLHATNADSGYTLYPSNDCSVCGQEAGKNPHCFLCTGQVYPPPVLAEEEVGIIREARVVHVESYSLDYEFVDEAGAGYGFACDKDGNPLVDKIQDVGLENLKKCQEGEYDVVYKGVVDNSYDYPEPALLLCYCGEVIELRESLTNECDGCGRLYNLSGQLLTPRHYWAEDCVY